MVEPTALLLWGIIVHLVADWPLQTEWMALHKSNLAHPASWVHSGIHGILMLLVFPWYLALGIAISHLLIDTRKPVSWWMRVVKKMSRESPHAFVVETGVDQVFHITVIALVVLLFYQ
jgi:hypothetical protein